MTLSNQVRVPTAPPGPPSKRHGPRGGGTGFCPSEAHIVPRTLISPQMGLCVSSAECLLCLQHKVGPRSVTVQHDAAVVGTHDRPQMTRPDPSALSPLSWGVPLRCRVPEPLHPASSALGLSSHLSLPSEGPLLPRGLVLLTSANTLFGRQSRSSVLGVEADIAGPTAGLVPRPRNHGASGHLVAQAPIRVSGPWARSSHPLADKLRGVFGGQGGVPIAGKG